MERESKCPLWEKFLDEVLPETEKQETLRSFVNSIPTRSIDKMLVLLGSGSNGKSIVWTIIADLFKYESILFGLSELMGKKSEYYLAIIDGKKVNLCRGLEGIKEPMFKQLISGENLMCRHPYGKPYMTTSLPMFVCETNNIPSKLSDGILRRLMIINFDVEIKNQDCHLYEKLSKEIDAIREWFGI